MLPYKNPNTLPAVIKLPMGLTLQNITDSGLVGQRQRLDDIPMDVGIKVECRYDTVMTVKLFYFDFVGNRTISLETASEHLTQFIEELSAALTECFPVTVSGQLCYLRENEYSIGKNHPMTLWQGMRATPVHLTFLGKGLPTTEVEPVEEAVEQPTEDASPRGLAKRLNALERRLTAHENNIHRQLKAHENILSGIADLQKSMIELNEKQMRSLDDHFTRLIEIIESISKSK